MTLPVIGNTTAKLAISLTAGQAKTIGFAADVDLPEGTYTLTVGETDIPTTQDDARTLSVAFPAENAALLWQQWRLQIDGIDFAGGPIIETLPNNPVGDTTESLAVNLGDSVVNLTATIAAGGGGPVDADQVVTPTYTGRLAGIDPDVQSVLDMIDAGLDDHYVALFVADGDYSGGTLTAATLYDTGYPVPRENLVGALVCVVSGDDMGLWTITASGPCTPGRAVDPGDVIRAYGQGLVALAGSSNGADVSGINVAATAARVDAVSAGVDDVNATVATLAATVGTQGDTLYTVTNDLLDLAKNASEAANGLDMLTTAAVTTPPLAWAECGWGNTAGDQERGYWRCTTLLPRPTTSLFAVFTARSLSGSTEEDDLYQELGSECLDSGGIPGAGGNDDLTEFAFRYHNGRLSTYDEWSAYGALMEWHRSQDPQVPAPEGFGVPPKTWVIVAKAVPDFSTGTILMLALSDHGMYIDPWLNLRWKVLQTYEMGEPYSMAESNGVEQWRGRGGGRFDIARARYFYDDVEVSDFDGLMGANGGTTITDRVLLDGNDDPAIWTAHDNAVNVNND
jgi:hypothetical protein